MDYLSYQSFPLFFFPLLALILLPHVICYVQRFLCKNQSFQYLPLTSKNLKGRIHICHFSPHRQFLDEFSSTQKCINCDKTDFATKVRKFRQTLILRQNSGNCFKIWIWSMGELVLCPSVGFSVNDFLAAEGSKGLSHCSDLCGLRASIIALYQSCNGEWRLGFWNFRSHFMGVQIFQIALILSAFKYFR